MDGRDYYFISKEDFLHRVARHEFVEFEEVYSGSFYGKLASELERIWNGGKDVIFDIDVEGGLRLKRNYHAFALAVFVQLPSLPALKERMEVRGTDTPEKLEELSRRDHEEIANSPYFY